MITMTINETKFDNVLFHHFACDSGSGVARVSAAWDGPPQATDTLGLATPLDSGVPETKMVFRKKCVILDIFIS